MNFINLESVINRKVMRKNPLLFIYKTVSTKQNKYEKQTIIHLLTDHNVSILY